MPRIRIVQTSDVHLRPDRPERRRALELVFAQAIGRSADVVIVAGDLFDRGSEAVSERAAVRKMVQEIAPRPVIFVPGNTDAEAYASSADFGTNAFVLSRTPYGRARAAGIDFVGVPYQQGKTLAECLTGVACEPRQTVLIAHGSLTDGVGASFAGDGEDGAFMPIFPHDLSRRCTYAALGHLHWAEHLVQRQNERLIAYAGTPVTTSRRELGPRCVVVVDFEPGVGVLAHEVVPLATPYYERVEAICMPGAEHEAIEQLAKDAVARKAPGVRVLARLSGVSTSSEDELREAASKILRRTWGTSPEPRTQAADDASAPILELAVTSYPQLAQIAVVSEFVSRLSAAARAAGVKDPRLLDGALRLGLGAFVESLP